MFYYKMFNFVNAASTGHEKVLKAEGNYTEEELEAYMLIFKLVFILFVRW